MSKFSENLKTQRKLLKLSQRDISFKIGVSQQCISEWENAKIEPTLSFLCKLADLFDMSLDELVGRNNYL